MYLKPSNSFEPWCLGGTYLTVKKYVRPTMANKLLYLAFEIPVLFPSFFSMVDVFQRLSLIGCRGNLPSQDFLGFRSASCTHFHGKNTPMQAL
jgi:hypothetical protein